MISYEIYIQECKRIGDSPVSEADYYDKRTKVGSCCEEVSPEIHKRHYIADDTLATERLAMCKTCKEYNKIGQCKLCHCFMRFKTKLTSSKCKLNKW